MKAPKFNLPVSGGVASEADLELGINEAFAKIAGDVTTVTDRLARRIANETEARRQADRRIRRDVATVSNDLEELEDDLEEGLEELQDDIDELEEELSEAERAARRAARQLAEELADLEGGAVLSSKLRMANRPGDLPSGFRVIGQSELAINANGSVLRLMGGAEVRSRVLCKIEHGRQYEARFVWRRHADSPDPDLDGVNLMVRWLDRRKRLISEVVLREVTGAGNVTVQAGRQVRVFTLSSTAGPDLVQWPPSADYVALSFRAFGDDSVRTDVEILGCYERPAQGEPGPAGDQGDQGLRGFDGRRGPAGAPATFIGIEYDATGGALPGSASEGDTFGLLGAGTVASYVWLSGAWRLALPGAPIARHPDHSPTAPSVWDIEITGNGTAGPYEVDWAGPILLIAPTGDAISPEDYTRAGTTVTFDGAVANAAVIRGLAFETGAGFQAQTVVITGDGTEGPYALPADAELAVLFGPAGYVPPADYAVDGDEITFADPVTLGAKVYGVAIVGTSRRTAPAVFDSRAEAEAYAVPTGVDTILVCHKGVTLAFRRDGAGTALTTAGGATWSPADPTPSPLHYGAPCNGVDDDAVAWIACGEENGAIYGLGATYTFLDACVFERGHRIGVIDLGGGELRLHQDVGYTPAITVRGAGLDAGTGGDGVLTTIATTIAEGASSVTMADASGVAVGDWLVLSSGEYWSGVTGASGYEVQTKGEWAQVRSKAGNVVTFTKPLREAYAASIFAVSVRRIEPIDSLTLRNGRVTGLAQEVGGDEAEATVYPSVLLAEFVDGVSIEGIETRGFAADTLAMAWCRDIHIQGCTAEGFRTVEANLPAPTQYWSTFADITASEHIRISGCHGIRLRTFCDVRGALAVSRDVVFEGNTGEDMWRPFGVHMAQAAVVTGNVVRSRQALWFRGKDLTCTGNHFDCYSDAATIRIGAAPFGSAYAEAPSAGAVTIIGNVLRCYGSNGILIRCAADRLVVSGNIIEDALNGLDFGGKSLGATVIDGNTISSALPDDDSTTASYGVVIANRPEHPLASADEIKVTRNIFTGRWMTTVAILGTDGGTGFYRALVADNSLGLARTRGVSFAAQGSSHGASGDFRYPPVVRGNSFTLPAPDDRVYHPAGGGWLAQTSALQGEPAFIARTGATPSSPAMTGAYAVGRREAWDEPAAGGSEGRVATRAGTGGVLAGVTGTITAGSPTLVVNDASNIRIGAHLSVVGAGLSVAARVIARSGTTLTLSHNAATSVLNAAVTYTPPILKAYGLIAA